MLTRDQWIIRRFSQGHNIEMCNDCGYMIPEYLGIFYHIFKTGHEGSEVIRGNKCQQRITDTNIIKVS